MDLDYFRRVAPVTDEIISIIIAAGWALLLGNLVFQATKSMMTGLGFEGEDPKLLFMPGCSPQSPFSRCAGWVWSGKEQHRWSGSPPPPGEGFGGCPAVR